MRCPICHEPLTHHNKVFVCVNHHSFDQARQGYVNLSRKQKSSGDNAKMVQARSAFLESGPYDFLREEIRQDLSGLHPGVLIDLGCGQGYYTKEFAQTARQSYGIDLSVPAIVHAAGQDKKTQYIVSSIFDLPFEDDSADVAVSIFTPLPEKEVHRVLKPNGTFLVAGPGREHLLELKEQLYEKVRLNDEPPAELEGFTLESRKTIRKKKHIDDVKSLLEMTPYAYKTSKEAMERIENLKEGLDVTFEFVISEWRKNDESGN